MASGQRACLVCGLPTTVRHRFNSFASSCVALALCREDGLVNSLHAYVNPLLICWICKKFGLGW